MPVAADEEQLEIFILWFHIMQPFEFLCGIFELPGVIQVTRKFQRILPVIKILGESRFQKC
jgi:hypothetical protein